MENYIIPVLILVAAIVLAQAFRIANENERFAVFTLGRFAGLRGPGLLMKVPGETAKWTRIKVGDRGELTAPGIGTFNDVQLPVLQDPEASLGAVIRITGFTQESVKVMQDPEQRRTIECEKCGHVMELP